MTAIDLLLTRRSVLARMMTTPGPNAAELERILQAGARVPDHGKLGPWRFIIIEGQARKTLGAVLEAVTRKAAPEATEKMLEIERTRFTRAPVVICVVSQVQICKIPEWEQVLSSGAACQNLLVAAHSSGYAAQWLTEWYAYDPMVKQALGVDEADRIAGFVYIGTPVEPPSERQRPDVADVVSVLEHELHLDAAARQALALGPGSEGGAQN